MFLALQQDFDWYDFDSEQISLEDEVDDLEELAVPFSHAGEVLRPRGGDDQPQEACDPPPFSGRRFGGAKRFIDDGFELRDANGKLAKYRIGQIVFIQDVRDGWLSARVTTSDVKGFMGEGIWHYKLTDESGKIDPKHWYPQSLILSEGWVIEMESGNTSVETRKVTLPPEPPAKL